MYEYYNELRKELLVTSVLTGILTEHPNILTVLNIYVHYCTK